MPEFPYGKATARSHFVNDRSTLGNRARSEAAASITRRIAAEPEVRGAATIAAYWSIGTEPDTHGLVARLAASGVRILLPVLLPDGDLDWAAYDPAQDLASGRLGLREPVGPRLGVEAIRSCDAIFVPALALSADGHRLGRGGGSYDRALARVYAHGNGPGTGEGIAAERAGVGAEAETPPEHRRSRRPWVCALVFDGELDAEVPVETHDQPVDAACSPSRLVRFR